MSDEIPQMFRKFAFIKTKKWLEIKRFQATENQKKDYSHYNITLFVWAF